MIGDVAVVYLNGKLVLGTEGSALFIKCVTQLISSGQKKVIADLGNVVQIDSTGVGDLVKSSVWLAHRDGSLRLVCPPGETKTRNALISTHLVQLIPTFDSIDQALRGFATPPLYCLCPICGGRSDPPFFESNTSYWQPQTCSFCDSRFFITTESSGSEVHLQQLKMLLYVGREDEFVEVTGGFPVCLNFVGRLDLFTSGTLERVLNAIPVPRRALIDLGHAIEITDGGLDALLALFKKLGAQDRLVMSLEGQPPDRVQSLCKLSDLLHPTKSAALAKLGPFVKTSPWAVHTEKLG
jgi:anti-anti-sigma regulatory factor